MKKLPTLRWYKYSVLFWVSLIVLDSCETREEVTPGVTQARQWFEQNRSTGWDAWPKGSTVQSIEWDQAITTGPVVEVPVRLNGNVSAHMYKNGVAQIQGASEVRLVLWPEAGKGYEVAVLQFIPQNGNIPRKLSEIEESGFSGLVLANRGGVEQKHVALFENGKPLRKQEGGLAENARLVLLYCL